MKSHPIFQLPAHRLGPYEMRAVPATRAAFKDKRRKIENDWSRGLCFIDENLDADSTLRYFLRHLIVAIHYRSGLNDKSDEESFTHSLASGLVELARRNENFWVSLQSIISAHWAEGENFDATAAGLPATENINRLPPSIRFGNRECALEWAPVAECEGGSVEAYGWYQPNTGPISLSVGLRGGNLPLVALHEVIHFLHDCVGLGDKSTELQFRDGQLKMLPSFIAQNPQFWHWWLNKARRPERLEQRLPRTPRQSALTPLHATSPRVAYA